MMPNLQNRNPWSSRNLHHWKRQSWMYPNAAIFAQQSRAIFWLCLRWKRSSHLECFIYILFNQSITENTKTFLHTKIKIIVFVLNCIQNFIVITNIGSFTRWTFSSIGLVHGIVHFHQILLFRWEIFNGEIFFHKNQI